MKQTQWLSTGLFALTLVVGACASPGDKTTTATATPPVWKTTDLIFEYRQQAENYRSMARRLELEAELAAQRQDQEQAREKLDLAGDMRAAADTADERARTFRRQVPHGQIY